MMVRVVAWRVWYADGSSHTSRGSCPEDLPQDGVVAIRQWYDEMSSAGRPYSRTLDGGDWYWWDGASWQKVPSAPWGSHQPEPDVPYPLRGVGVSDEEFAKFTELVAKSVSP